MKLNINELCRLAKIIEMHKQNLNGLLRNELYTLKVDENHLKNKMNPETIDEHINPNDGKEMHEITVEQILELMDLLNEDKLKLTCLIEKAKYENVLKINEREMSIDAATEYNKSLREELFNLTILNKLKKVKTKKDGFDYKFDNEAKQTRYTYQIEITKEPTFDLKLTKAKEKNLKELANNISTEIEKIKINTVLDYEGFVGINDTFEDLLEKYIDKINTK